MNRRWQSGFDFDGRPAVFIDFGNVADILALFGDGMAGQVVLVILSLVALEEAAGVAAVGKAFEFAQQAVVKRTACNGIINSLCGRTGRRGRRSRATWCGLDFEAVHTDFGEFFDDLNTAQVFGIMM